MGKYLNSMVPFEMWKQMVGTRFFVDKTLLLEEVLNTVETDGQRFLCITRPHRFGKSVMANMVGAFLGKASDSENIFRELAISENVKYKKDLNQHNVIFIDFSRVPRDCSSYEQYMNRIQDGINQDLEEAYPEVRIDVSGTVWDNLLEVFEKTKETFVFVIDEWDAVFHMPFITGDRRQEYLAFLRNLLKDQAYVKLAYMTGVLPIAKYSSGSELNMFVEYDMTVMERFSSYFGFTEEEVNQLFGVYLNLVLMIAGGGIEAEIQNYAAVSMELNTKDEIYSAMVIYGLLTYADGAVYIPNKELMDKFRELLMNKESMGYVKIQQKGTLHVEKIL